MTTSTSKTQLIGFYWASMTLGGPLDNQEEMQKKVGSYLQQEGPAGVLNAWEEGKKYFQERPADLNTYYCTVVYSLHSMNIATFPPALNASLSQTSQNVDLWHVALQIVGLLRSRLPQGGPLHCEEKKGQLHLFTKAGFHLCLPYNQKGAIDKLEANLKKYPQDQVLVFDQVLKLLSATPLPTDNESLSLKEVVQELLSLTPTNFKEIEPFIKILRSKPEHAEAFVHLAESESKKEKPNLPFFRKQLKIDNFTEDQQNRLSHAYGRVLLTSKDKDILSALPSSQWLFEHIKESQLYLKLWITLDHKLLVKDPIGFVEGLTELTPDFILYLEKHQKLLNTDPWKQAIQAVLLRYWKSEQKERLLELWHQLMPLQKDVEAFCQNYSNIVEVLGWLVGLPKLKYVDWMMIFEAISQAKAPIDIVIVNDLWTLWIIHHSSNNGHSRVFPIWEIAIIFHIWKIAIPTCLTKNIPDKIQTFLTNHVVDLLLNLEDEQAKELAPLCIESCINAVVKNQKEMTPLIYNLFTHQDLKKKIGDLWSLLGLYEKSLCASILARHEQDEIHAMGHSLFTSLCTSQTALDSFVPFCLSPYLPKNEAARISLYQWINQCWSIHFKALHKTFQPALCYLIDFLIEQSKTASDPEKKQIKLFEKWADLIAEPIAPLHICDQEQSLDHSLRYVSLAPPMLDWLEKEFRLPPNQQLVEHFIKTLPSILEFLGFVKTDGFSKRLKPIFISLMQNPVIVQAEPPLCYAWKNVLAALNHKAALHPHLHPYITEILVLSLNPTHIQDLKLQGFVKAKSFLVYTSTFLKLATRPVSLEEQNIIKATNHALMNAALLLVGESKKTEDLLATARLFQYMNPAYKESQ
jgi:hypothetical protein